MNLIILESFLNHHKCQVQHHEDHLIVIMRNHLIIVCLEVFYIKSLGKECLDGRSCKLIDLVTSQRIRI